MTEEYNIQSCPRCGDFRDVELIRSDEADFTVEPCELYQVYKIRCKFCGYGTYEYRNFSDAVKEWNRRPSIFELIEDASVADIGAEEDG